jgi:anti-sigma factor (TIGR02949 family)
MTEKMSCEEVIAKLYEYLDQEVDSKTSKNIDHHIHGCRECFSRLEFEKKLRQRVSSSVDELETPDDIKNRLEALLKRF